MKLSSRPKPVRIRISMGGKEHTSLESLKENITPQILEFIDGRLQRWLKQQNLDSLSDAIDRIKENNRRGEPIKLLNIYNKLTGKSHKTLLSFVYEWKGDIKSKELLTYYIRNEKSDTTVIENTLDYISLDEWDEIISSINDSRLDLYLANKYAEKGNLLESKRIYEKIKERGDCPEAEELYDEYFSSVNFISKLFKNSKEELEEIAEDFSKFTKLRINSSSSNNYLRIAEEVFSLIGTCNKIFSVREYEIISVIERTFPEAFKSSETKIERLCIIAMLMGSVSVYRLPYKRADVLDSIPDACPFKRRVANCSSISTAKKITKDIIHYLLFDRFTK